MGLNLRDVLACPGSQLPFRHRLEMDRLDFPSVLSYLEAPEGEGVVRNEAGTLTLTGTHPRPAALCVRPVRVRF